MQAPGLFPIIYSKRHTIIWRLTANGRRKYGAISTVVK